MAKVNLLLPVWGSRYVRQFLALSLPSLLADGNLPALSRSHQVTFQFLTTASDFSQIKREPCIQLLEEFAEISHVEMGDLLDEGGSYTFQMSQIFGRAIRNFGAAATDQYFCIILADYVYADGSLAEIGRRISDGARAIFQGNFGCIEEEVEETLAARVDASTHVLAIHPRELVAMSLQHLHPVTVSRFVDQSVSHHTYPNRFFWRGPDSTTIVGRYFLLHPFCIRPERVMESVEGFVDYAFFPDLCPSGQSEVIQDSDQFFIMELEKRTHEARGIELGPYDDRSLFEHLASWTTKEHRTFPHYPIVFHAADVSSEALRSVVDTSDAFVRKISANLKSAPHSHRDHWYWRGAQGQALRKQQRRAGTWARLHATLRPQPPLLRVYQPTWEDFAIVRTLEAESASRGRAQVYATAATRGLLSLEDCTFLEIHDLGRFGDSRANGGQSHRSPIYIFLTQLDDDKLASLKSALASGALTGREVHFVFHSMPDGGVASAWAFNLRVAGWIAEIFPVPRLKSVHHYVGGAKLLLAEIRSQLASTAGGSWLRTFVLTLGLRVTILGIAAFLVLRNFATACGLRTPTSAVRVGPSSTIHLTLQF